MNKLSRQIVWSLFTFLISIGVLFVILKNREVIKEKGQAISSVIFSIDDYLSKPFLPLQHLVDNTKHLFATYEENEILKKENVLLRLENSQLRTLQEENATLKEGLELKEKDNSKIVVPAKVMTRSPIKWYEKLMLDRGQRSGVEEGMLVLSEGGLVGVVTERSDRSSLVSLLTTTKQFSPIPIKVLSEDEVIFGILSAYDDEKEVFVMTQLSSDKPILQNSQVLTSGLDGRSLADLPVGTVVGTEDNQDRLLRKIYIKSLVDFSDLSEVLIVGK